MTVESVLSVTGGSCRWLTCGGWQGRRRSWLGLVQWLSHLGAQPGLGNLVELPDPLPWEFKAGGHCLPGYSHCKVGAGPLSRPIRSEFKRLVRVKQKGYLSGRWLPACPGWHLLFVFSAATNCTCPALTMGVQVVQRPRAEGEPVLPSLQLSASQLFFLFFFFQVLTACFIVFWSPLECSPAIFKKM